MLLDDHRWLHRNGGAAVIECKLACHVKTPWRADS